MAPKDYDELLDCLSTMSKRLVSLRCSKYCLTSTTLMHLLAHAIHSLDSPCLARAWGDISKSDDVR